MISSEFLRAVTEVNVKRVKSVLRGCFVAKLCVVYNVSRLVHETAWSCCYFLHEVLRVKILSACGPEIADTREFIL